MLRGLIRAGAPVMLALAAVSSWSSAEDAFLAFGVDRPREPRLAPPLALPGLDGREPSATRDLRGRPVLLSFFTTT
jgi:hypothetical protein